MYMEKLSLLYVYLPGDIVQFGSTTVFRFNHPQEAAEMKGGSDEVCLHTLNLQMKLVGQVVYT